MRFAAPSMYTYSYPVPMCPFGTKGMNVVNMVKHDDGESAFCSEIFVQYPSMSAAILDLRATPKDQLMKIDAKKLTNSLPCPNLFDLLGVLKPLPYNLWL